ncbi:MAG: hypothetical protein ABFD17_09030 [Anaerolineaceae bacterium]
MQRFAGSVAFRLSKPNHLLPSRNQQLPKDQLLALSPSTVLRAKPLLEDTPTLPVQSHHPSTTNLVWAIINRLPLRIILIQCHIQVPANRIKGLFLLKAINHTVNSPLRDTNSSQGVTLNPTPVMRSKIIRLISRIPNTRVRTEVLILIRLLAGTSNAQIVGH